MRILETILVGVIRLYMASIWLFAFLLLVSMPLLAGLGTSMVFALYTPPPIAATSITAIIGVEIWFYVQVLRGTI